jgi:nitric oxide reductase large subunit
MDSIDITDSAFSLNIPEVNEVISFNTTDNTMYIYIGVTILVVLIAIFIYKYYQTKNMSKEYSEMDCPGGFCTMNHNS